MQYALIQNNTVAQFPYSETQFRRDNPRTSFPRKLTLPAEGQNGTLVEVVEAGRPTVTNVQVVVPDATPALVGGVWTLGWSVRDKTTEEIEAEHQAKVGLVAAEWQRRVDIGGVFSVTGVADPIPVPGRQPYREIIQAKLSAAQLFAAQGVTDPVVMFRDGDNTNHMLTPSQMIELCIASMQFYEALSEVYWAMKDGTGDFTGGIPQDFTDDSYWP